MPGPLPSPGSSRPDRAFAVLEGGGGTVPDLPVLMDGGEPVVWCAEAQRAWESIWGSPLASEIHDVDLAGVHAALFGLNKYYTGEKTSAALLTEFRQWAREFGLTPAARRRMRVHLGSGSGEAASPAPTENKRSRPDPRLR